MKRALLVAGLVAIVVAGGVIWARLRSDERDDALIAAVEAGDVAAVHKFLAAGADPNSAKVARASGPFAFLQALRGRGPGEKAVSLAVNNKAWPVAEVLVKAGADVSGDFGIEALHLAGADEATAFMGLLLERGVPVDGLALHGQVTPKGQTVLARALIDLKPQTATFVLKRGASVQSVLTPHPNIVIDGKVSRALDWYSGTGFAWNGAVVRALVEHGVSPDVVLWRGRESIEPLLVTAVLHNDLRTVEFLLARGATLEAKTNRGETAYYIATIQTRPEIEALLKKAGAKKYWD